MPKVTFLPGTSGTGKPDHTASTHRLPAYLPLLIIGIVYVTLHIASLGVHPFVHSDEAWLASLTRSMLHERSLAATEDVFALTHRHPHALKTLYHLLQMPFVAFSWSAAASRLPSFIAGIASLLFLYRIAGNLGLDGILRWAPALLVAADPQFWYLSHLGRQEMVLIMLFLWSWDLKGKKRSPWKASLPLAVGVFIHPNAFVIALPLGAMYLVELFNSSRRSSPGLGQGVLEVLRFTIFPILAAVTALAFSLVMDPEFLGNYTRFGDSVGAGDSWAVKFLGLPNFVTKMASRKAGTYFLAEIRPFLLVGLFSWLGILIRLILPGYSERHRRHGEILPAIPAMLLGMALVGKYGPPTIGFLMPLSYLSYACVLSPLPGEDTRRERSVRRERAGRASVNRFSATAVLLLCAGLTGLTTTELARSGGQVRYRDYRNFIQVKVDGDGRVLGNLNTAFAFETDRLRIWRDLEYLPEGEGELEAFIDSEDIRWILLPDELQLIYESRPVWNRMYGNPRWYPQLEEVLERRGQEVAVEEFPVYSMRILPFMDRKDWALSIYRIE